MSIEQKIIAASEMSDFLQEFANKGMNVNILTTQPYSFEKGDDGCWRVKKYLWVYISVDPKQMIAKPQPSPLIIPRPKPN